MIMENSRIMYLHFQMLEVEVVLRLFNRMYLFIEPQEHFLLINGRKRMELPLQSKYKRLG